MMKVLVPVLGAVALLLGGLQPAFADQHRVTKTFLGNSDIEAKEGQGGEGTSSTSTNNGNPDNTSCNDCGSTGPGKKN